MRFFHDIQMVPRNFVHVDPAAGQGTPAFDEIN
jgi:hypothetical protein